MTAPAEVQAQAGDMLAALQAASGALARAKTDETGILTNLQQQVQRLLPPGRVHIVLFLEDQTQLYAWNRRGEAFPPSYFDTPAAQGIIGWLRQTRESLLVGDFDRDWERLPAQPSYENSDPPRSAIFVPLLVADEALGALSVQNDRPDIYTTDHFWQLRILANQAAASLQAGRLLQAERRRANQLETLAEITRSVVSILDLDTLLTHIVDVIEDNFHYYHVQVFVVDKESEHAIFRASSVDETHELWRQLGRSVQIGEEGIIGWVLAHGEPLVAPDVSIDPLYVPDDPRLLPDTRSEIAIPLRLEDEVLGVLDVQSDRLDAFGPEDLFVLNALADAVALAVDNAQLYARVQEDAWITVALLEVAEATNRLTSLGDVVETIVRITPLLTGVVACAIWLGQAESNTLEAQAEWGVPDEMVRLFYKHSLSPAQNPVLDRLDRQRRPQVLRPDETDELLAPIIGQALRADVVIFLPLLAKGDMIGAMAVSIDESEKPFNDSRLPLLKGIADQAASAIENARLIAAQREEAWVSAALLQVAEAIGRVRTVPDTLDAVARLTAGLSGLDRCTILLRQGRSDEFLVGISYALSRELSPFSLDQPLDPAHTPWLERLLASRAPVVLADLDPPDLIPADLAAPLGKGALVAVPLIVANQVIGVLLVDGLEPRRVHNPRLLDILGGIANQAAVALERARLRRSDSERQRINTELDVARGIQKGFLPETVPQPPGYEIAALWEPARQIGGDFYDFIPLAGGRLGVVVADVADKGIPAALYMALSRTAMRLVSTRDPSPANILERVNTAILDTTYSDMFVTMYYAVLDPATHQVTYASGGHGLALQAAHDEVVFLRGKGTVLGVFPDVRPQEFQTTLAPGDYLLLYTDGVTDAINADTAEFGEERLVQVLRQRRGLSAAAMLACIRAEVQAWTGDAAAFDDFTLVVVRRAAGRQG